MFIELPAVYGTALITLLASIVIQSHAVRASCFPLHNAFSAAVTNKLYVHCVMSLRFTELHMLIQLVPFQAYEIPVSNASQTSHTFIQDEGRLL